MYDQNMKSMPTYDVIFGTKPLTEAQIHIGLKEFSSIAIMHMCAKLMLYLNSEDALEPKKQTELALGLLSNEERAKLAEFVNESENPYIAFFHHAPVMMMVKLNLDDNDASGLAVDDVSSHTKFAKLLLSLSDLWIAPGSALPANLGDKVARKRFIEGFRAYQTRQFLQENASEPMLNLLARGRYLLDQAQQDMRVTFSETFKSAAGIDLTLYMDILMMLLAQWAIDVDITKLDDISVRSTGEYFSHTTISDTDVEKFLRVVGFKASEYRSLNAELLSRIGMPRDNTLVNFITFMTKPIVRFDDRFICLSPRFLLLQLTDGPYNIVREAIKGTGQSPQLPTVWGDVYEKYVVERFKSAFGDSAYPNIADKSGREALDLLIDLGEATLLIEIKYPHWPFKARITGKRADMHSYLARIAKYNPRADKKGGPKTNDKKGFGQIKQFIEKVDAHEVTPPVDLNTKPLIPVLVLGEEYPCDPFNRSYLEDYAACEGCLILNDKRVLPFILLTTEDVELIESLAEELGADRAKELIFQYAMRFHPKFKEEQVIKQATSFKNEIFNQGIRVKNSKFMSAQRKQAFELALKHFKEHPGDHKAAQA